MESLKPASRSSAYLPLGIVFIVLGVSMKGMIAFIVGAAFLYIYYNQQRKAKN
jgi:Na+(H+)/acetate symporter ActP